LFQGQLWTQETGLNDYRNCVELPVMGVFLQPDPIGFKGDAANIYRFCNNNAVNRTDPFGLVPPAEGLMDLPKKDMQEMFKAGQEAARKTRTEKSPDGPGGKLRHQEHRFANYENNRSGERKNAHETGYHKDELPMTERPKNPFNEPATQKWDVHSHISGSGKPINADPGAAISLHVPFGTQSATGGPMYILAPTQIKGAGPSGLFYTPDGIRLYDAATHNPVPH
jgi:RHS repeat-associated protein